MRIYLASRYSRRAELVEYRTRLEALGHVVTSRWLNGDHQISDVGVPIAEDGEALVESDGDTPEAATLREHFATEDVADVESCDMLVAFTEAPRSGHSRGGRHVEFGLALGLGKSLVIVGPRENVFSWLPEVEHFDTFDEFHDGIAWLSEGIEHVRGDG